MVGINSSGKSTFLRAFPLLKQSIEKRIIGPIVWVGNYVDFGSFSDALQTNAQTREIAFNFGQDYSLLRSQRWDNWYPWMNEVLVGSFSGSYSISVAERTDELKSTYAKEFGINLKHKDATGAFSDSDQISISITPEQDIRSLIRRLV